MSDAQAEEINQSLTLSDGRTLGFAAYGPQDGPPVFYFTGGNSSRLEGRWFIEAAQAEHVRLIVPDRPGFGLSTFQPGRRFLDWPQDVLQLADALGIGDFSIFGLSGGGPHVLATVYRHADRVRKSAIVSGAAPPEMKGKLDGMWPPVRLIYLTARYLPAVNRFLLKQMAAFYSNEVQMVRQMKRALPKPDAELIARRPEIISIFAQSTQEALRQGLQGDAWEWQMYVRPWGFQVKDIRKEIKLWYGLSDQQAPAYIGRYLVGELPHSELITVDDGGHFSTINNHIGEIFAYLRT